MDNKIICIECKKTIKESKAKPIHRSCWLKIRSKEDRCYDFLFCKDKKNIAKTKIITPQIPQDIAGNIID